MKEIGSFLRDTRINNGVSLEEAAEDLNISVIQLENIEDGNIRAFKDVFTLRELIKDYGKYLGIKTDDIIDEFNDFMFEHTSKISLDDILEARRLAKEKDESENQKVVSPYTYVKTSKIKLNLLKIKPRISLVDGEMKVTKKYIGNIEVSLIKYMNDLLKECPPNKKRAFITYSSFMPVANEIEQKLKEFGFKEVIQTFAGPTICTHCGKKTLGIIYEKE